jgi:hypothetical protein
LSRDGEGFLLIEDLLSTNGTFVNGAQVLKKRISMSDKIVLGSNYQLNISEALKSKNDYREEFAALKPVYDEFVAQKVRIQSATTFRSRLFQALPFALPGIVGVAIGFSGKGSPLFLGISLLVAVCAPAAGVYFGAKQAAKAPKLLQDLSHRFKIDYVCPKCGAFLGEIPWESLANKKQCHAPGCKAKWS